MEFESVAKTRDLCSRPAAPLATEDEKDRLSSLSPRDIACMFLLHPINWELGIIPHNSTSLNTLNLGATSSHNYNIDIKLFHSRSDWLESLYIYCTEVLHLAPK